MEIVRRVHAMKEIAKQTRGRGLKIGFVPTMGFLHEGHLNLIRLAKELSDVVVVSIFVNPTQFGAGEDFQRYPRDLTRDADLCIAEGVEYVFTPEPHDIYPPGPRTFVEIEDLSSRLEGASRPGHFRGVATVVLKLFEVVRPDIAVFGQKDAQQVAVVKRMTSDLLLDTEIVVAPIVRDDDGLALSSRNGYLDDAQREAAAAIPRALDAVEQAVEDGERDAAALEGAARKTVEEEPTLRVDYAALVDPETFEPLNKLETRGLLVLAVHCGSIRLLDNMLLEAAEPRG